MPLEKEITERSNNTLNWCLSLLPQTPERWLVAPLHQANSKRCTAEVWPEGVSSEVTC